MQLCLLAQKLVDDRHSNFPGNEAFEQSGILNGASVVKDYLEHGELGVALEHLFYMVNESGIKFPTDSLSELHSLAITLNVQIGDG